MSSASMLGKPLLSGPLYHILLLTSTFSLLASGSSLPTPDDADISMGYNSTIYSDNNNYSAADVDGDNSDSSSMLSMCNKNPMSTPQCRGLIIGGSVGGFVVLCIVLYCCYYILRSNVRASDSDSDDEESFPQTPTRYNPVVRKLRSMWFKVVNCGREPEEPPHYTPRVVEMSGNTANATPSATPLLPARAHLRGVSYASSVTPMASPLLPAPPQFRNSRIEPFAGFATVEQEPQPPDDTAPPAYSSPIHTSPPVSPVFPGPSTLSAPQASEVASPPSSPLLSPPFTSSSRIPSRVHSCAPSPSR